MLCKSDLDKFLRESHRRGFEILWSHKLDGVRCLAEVSNGKVTYWSRNGKQFGNFDILTEQILALTFEWRRRPVVLDGEVISVDKSFYKVMTQIHKQHEVDPSIFRFHIFDFLFDQKFNHPLSFRLKALRELAWQRDVTNKLKYVEHTRLRTRNTEEIIAMRDAIIAQGGEGMVLKAADSPYKGKKSIHWCKLKGEETEDLKVIGWEYGKGKYKETVGKLLCDRNGVTVKVSGMKDAERDEFLHHLPEMIEVEFQEVTPSGSLRHPRFVRVREDK
jgi:DNA ligase-1